MININPTNTAQSNWPAANQRASAKPKEAEGQKPVDDKTDDVTQTTVNTGRVDAEIKGLKDKVGQLQERLQRADASERVKLEEQLAQANAELSNKNTDAYRKANASVSTVDFYV